MKRGGLAVLALALCACAIEPVRPPVLTKPLYGIDSAVGQALLPPMGMEMPVVRGQPIDARFDLSVANAPAQRVFMSLANGTRYSMLVHPAVTGTISIDLKDVTIHEALDSIRDLYGYDFEIEGNRIFVQSPGLQTRMFQVNYLPGLRRGSSNLRMQSGAASADAAAAGAAATVSRAMEASQVSTEHLADFWAELRAALAVLVGTGEGRSVVVTPQSGVVVIRAMPEEVRAVRRYLRATRIAVERQVVLEAMIVEVTFSDAHQAGINWALFRNPAPNPAPGAIFGLALQTSNFATLLRFLESQGNVQVLSSPRLATLNGQKAVLKVGTDEFFVTGVATTATSSGASAPTVSVQPFFSGIVLDVTPQIDEAGNVILHIHPSLSEVSESTRVVNLGAQVAELRLPLARSTVSESDTVVRVSDGNIVAIGGLMSVDIRDTSRVVRRKELVMLMKPTVIQSDREREAALREPRSRLESPARPAGAHK